MKKNNKKALELKQDFVKIVRQDVAKIRETENYAEIGKAFVFWILINYFELDEETAASNIIDSPNDKRVDAFIEEEGDIKIIQCGYNPKST